MYKRHLSIFLKKVAHQYPILTLIGPRQSGKSTLSQKLFNNYDYVSLENPDQRQMALEDPRGFFKKYSKNLIIDEVQRVPELLSYLQGIVDQAKSKQKFVLTGSHQLLLMEKITQSLAGRTVISKLLPLSRREILDRPVAITHKTYPNSPKEKLEKYILRGGYPRIYDKNLDSNLWHEQYYQSYVERDVRVLSQIHDWNLFDRFVRLCAARAGSLLNLSSLANDCGISQPSARHWLSLLQVSFIAFTLQPHFNNFNKRITKSPKLYFYDTGLLCYLLKIKKADTLVHHPMRGALFENWVITEWMKSFYNQGQKPPFYFWQNAKGQEVDLILDEGTQLYPTEIKSAATFHPDFVKNLNYFQKIQGSPSSSKKQFLGECLYGGEESFEFKNFWVRSWGDL